MFIKLGDDTLIPVLLQKASFVTKLADGVVISSQAQMNYFWGPDDCWGKKTWTIIWAPNLDSFSKKQNMRSPKSVLEEKIILSWKCAEIRWFDGTVLFYFLNYNNCHLQIVNIPSNAKAQ